MHNAQLKSLNYDVKIKNNNFFKKNCFKIRLKNNQHGSENKSRKDKNIKITTITIAARVRKTKKTTLPKRLLEITAKRNIAMIYKNGRKCTAMIKIKKFIL